MSDHSSLYSEAEADAGNTNAQRGSNGNPDEIKDIQAEVLSSARAQEREIKNQSRDIFNRLRSIAVDASFVQLVHEHYPELAVVPNARCGSWYCPPKAGVLPAYFKSTDGHTNNYKFSLRRPNLHLIPIIKEQGGIILVDSTRRGKLFPDALSRTVPIWCAVINTALGLKFPRGQDTWLFTSPRSVSPSEHAVISSLIGVFTNSLLDSALVLPGLAKPIRPFWIHPQSTSFPSFPTECDFYPIICLSASRKVGERAQWIDQDQWGSGWGYVQGAGDDEEGWAKGLTPELYWRHKAQLDKCARADLSKLM
ncbi:initiator tRNA phosphoribosyl transferase, partial [Dacryopinax primogenitus]